MQMEHNYHYGNEANQYAFYRLPRALFTDERYRTISGEAKILYGLFLDRMDLSLKNGWIDEKGRVFLYFTLDSIQEKMGCCRAKASKMLNELDKKCGLIERVRQGQGKPTKIYVRKFIAAPESKTSEKQTINNMNSLAAEKQTSRHRKNRSSEVRKTDCNQTEKNKTDYSHTEYQSIYPAKSSTQQKAMDRMDEINACRNLIMKNIEYDILAGKVGKERMDEIVNIIVDAVSTGNPNTRIGGDEYPAEVVRSRLLKLDASHIEYVLDCMDKNTTKVHNIKAYLLTALYNAPATIDHYYSNMVNHDLYGQKE